MIAFYKKKLVFVVATFVDGTMNLGRAAVMNSAMVVARVTETIFQMKQAVMILVEV